MPTPHENLVAKLTTFGELSVEMTALAMQTAMPEEIIASIDVIESSGLPITTELLRCVTRNLRPNKLHQGLSKIMELGLLEGEQGTMLVELFADHDKPDALAKIIEVAHGLHYEIPFPILCGNSEPERVLKALSIMSRTGLLTPDAQGQANCVVILNHAEVSNVTRALEQLSRCYLMTTPAQAQINLTALTHHPVPGLLPKMITTIAADSEEEHAEENQELLTRLFAQTEVLFGTEELVDLWFRIPEAVLFRELLVDAIEICETHAADTVAAQTAIRGLILGFTEQQAVFLPPELILPLMLNPHAIVPNPIAVFNAQQNTHTASVHKSVSQSAKKLMVRYGEHIAGPAALESMLAEMNTWMGSLAEDSPKVAAAKRGIIRISAPDYLYVDAASTVSLHQLLAICFMAIHDREHCHATLADAQALLIDGLYEIQRGYNLSAANVDVGGADKSICVPGTFNKLIEKLGAIHSDCSVIFMTKKTAAQKFPCVVIEEVDAYLTRCAQPKNIEELHAFMDLMKDLRENGIESIWESIKTAVGTRMLEEFGSLYTGEEDADFLSLMEAAIYIDAGDLRRFQKHILESPGYHQYCTQTIRQQGLFSLPKPVELLWTKRQESAIAQKEFDKAFGLVLKKD